MANYGIGGMVPDVVGSVAGGLKAAQGLDYWEDRKRRMAAQDQAQQRQTTMDKNTLGRQAVADFSQIAKNVNMEDPTEIKQALAWAASRSPEMKNVVWEAIQGGPETSRNLINMFQGQDKSENKKTLEQKLKERTATFKTSKDLRAEISKETGEFQKVTNAFDRIAVSGKDPSAAGDLSLIFNYMKMLDPNSVVRESEFATAANAAGVPDRVRNVFNKIISGERLAKGQRKQFIEQAGKLYKSANRRNEKTLDFYRDYAGRYEIPVEDIIVERGKPQKIESRAPVVKSTKKHGDITDDDIQETMKANNMTYEEVMERLEED